MDDSNILKLSQTLISLGLGTEAKIKAIHPYLHIGQTV